MLVCRSALLLNRANDVESCSIYYQNHPPVLRCVSCTLTFIGVSTGSLWIARHD